LRRTTRRCASSGGAGAQGTADRWQKPLPDRPGQAVYLARLKVASTYKDLTDALPSRIGQTNKFGVPPY
jgi:hypothetical protein